MKSPVKKAAITVAPANLFPTFATLDEAVAHAMAQIPEAKNQIYSILMCYHNTLLSEMDKQRCK